MASCSALSTFLAEVERRAYKQARYAVQDRDAALDIVQDAMFKLADRYPHAPAAELPLLFQRILQNTIRDYYRRSKVRNTWLSLFSVFLPRQQDESEGLAFVADLEGIAPESESPDGWLARKHVVIELESAIEKLPARQREAFLLRYWEGLDVAETALAMQCSQGSVKTHCSRATHSLAVWLTQRGVSL